MIDKPLENEQKAANSAQPDVLKNKIQGFRQRQP
jgi:hypothetical protein